MKKIRVFLVASATEERAELIEYMKAQKDIIITGITDDVQEGLEKLKKLPKQAIIMDTKPKNGDAVEFICKVRMMPMRRRQPYIFVVEESKEESAKLNLYKLGANYAVFKKNPSCSPIMIIDHLRMMRKFFRYSGQCG